MAHFYGVLGGSRGQATRCGTKGSGMTATAASWDGAVRSTLYDRDGIAWVTVELIPWHGHGTSRVLYDGAVRGGGSAQA